MSRSKRCIAIWRSPTDEDRFVIPTSHRELAEDAFPERNGCGFTFGDGCHGSDTKFNLFNSRRIDAIDVSGVRKHGEGE